MLIKAITKSYPIYLLVYGCVCVRFRAVRRKMASKIYIVTMYMVYVGIVV